MSARIYFSAWNLGNLKCPAYAMDNEYPESDCVGAAIARKNGLQVITVRADGTALERGVPAARHYQATLGRPCKGGGWTPIKQIWFSIDI